MYINWHIISVDNEIIIARDCTPDSRSIIYCGLRQEGTCWVYVTVIPPPETKLSTFKKSDMLFGNYIS